MEEQTNLPWDFLHSVLARMSSAQLSKAALVCRSWRALSLQSVFWRHVDPEHRQLSHADVLAIARRQPGILSLDLGRQMRVIWEEEWRGILAALPQLERLTLGIAACSDHWLAGLEAAGPCLISLRVRQALRVVEQRSAWLREVTIAHNGLRELEIAHFSGTQLRVAATALSRFVLKSFSCVFISLVCPGLEYLDLSRCDKLPESSIRSALQGCSRLRDLNLSNCQRITDDTLSAIAASCRSLTFLEVSRCPQLALDRLNLPSVVCLKALGSEVAVVARGAFADCPWLSSLTLDHAQALTHLDMDAPRLASLSLECCKKLQELVVLSYALKELNLQVGREGSG